MVAVAVPASIWCTVQDPLWMSDKQVQMTLGHICVPLLPVSRAFRLSDTNAPILDKYLVQKKPLSRHDLWKNQDEGHAPYPPTYIYKTHRCAAERNPSDTDTETQTPATWPLADVGQQN